MIPAVLLAASVLYGLIVVGTLAWLHLEGRLDRLELLIFPRHPRG